MSRRRSPGDLRTDHFSALVTAASRVTDAGTLRSVELRYPAGSVLPVHAVDDLDAVRGATE